MGQDPDALLAKLERLVDAVQEEEAIVEAGGRSAPFHLPEDGDAHLTFVVGGVTYALETRIIREIVRRRALARVPRAEAELVGVLNLRGSVFPVFDLRPLVGLERQEWARNGRILILDADRGAFGLCVDAVGEIVAIAPSSVATLHASGDPDDALLRGRTENAINLLDGDVLVRRCTRSAPSAP